MMMMKVTGLVLAVALKACATDAATGQIVDYPIASYPVERMDGSTGRFMAGQPTDNDAPAFDPLDADSVYARCLETCRAPLA
jgi:hypothetical protein